VTARPLISVVIPSYERQHCLPRALECVHDQEGRGQLFELEVFVIDDASPTPQETCLQDIPLQINVVRLDRNGGAAAARNQGIVRATGDYISFLDTDDIWFPHKLARQLRFLNSLPDPAASAIGCGVRIKRESRAHWHDVYPPQMRAMSDFVSSCRQCPGTTLFAKADLIRRVGPFDDTLQRLEDYEWFIRLGKAGGCFLPAPEILARIEPSKSARKDSVYAAARAILEKHGADLGTADEKRRMQSYLSLEKAAAAFRARDYPGAVGNMVQSMIGLPRTSIHLAAFQTAPPVR